MTSTAPDDAGLVVVGGGPAGHAAAVAYREAGGPGPVLLLSADTTIPYDRPPLSKDFLRGDSDLDGLPMESEEFYRDRGIEVRLGTRVRALDAAAHVVTLEDGTTIPYRRCVLATGSVPKRLPVPGGDAPFVHVLRSAEEASALRDRAEGATTAVVVGSGFIGCEAAASLARRGLSVTVLTSEEAPQAARLGDDVASRIRGWLEEAGVTVVGSAEVERIDADGAGGRVTLTDGRSFHGDLVLTAVGVEPQGALAGDAGLALDDTGRVRVDAAMRTSSPDVFAAGDVARADNPTAGRELAVEHWGEALAMGEVAGRSAAGDDAARWAEVPGFWSEIGDRTLKYAAWGDGYDTSRTVDHVGGGFTVWYEQDGAAVGVLTHEADENYEGGRTLIEAGRPAP